MAGAKLLSVGDLLIHDTVIYAVCKKKTATSALIFNAVYGRFSFNQPLAQRRAVAAKVVVVEAGCVFSNRFSGRS